MENRIKAETTPTIADLQLANIRTVMVTGDNVELDVFHVELTLGVPYVCRLAFYRIHVLFECALLTYS